MAMLSQAQEMEAERKEFSGVQEGLQSKVGAVPVASTRAPFCPQRRQLQLTEPGARPAVAGERARPDAPRFDNPAGKQMKKRTHTHPKNSFLWHDDGRDGGDGGHAMCAPSVKTRDSEYTSERTPSAALPPARRPSTISEPARKASQHHAYGPEPKPRLCVGAEPTPMGREPHDGGVDDHRVVHDKRFNILKHRLQIILQPRFIYYESSTFQIMDSDFKSA
jgi:hypothetical protein